MRRVDKIASRCRDESGGDVSANSCATSGGAGGAGAIVIRAGVARRASVEVGAVVSLNDGDS